MGGGGEDLAKIVGDLCLGRAQENESFFPLGDESDAPALADLKNKMLFVAV